MPRQNFIEKIIESFSKDSKIVLDEKENEYRERLLHVLDVKLKNMMFTDHQVYTEVKKKYQFITYPQICNDVSICERMIANEKDPQGDPKKVWTRYFIVENAKKAYAIAEDKGDAYTMGFLLNIIGKHNLTDREDPVKPPFEDIIPFLPEITSNPEVLGIKPINNVKALKAKLRAKYNIPERITEIINYDEQSD